MSNVEITDVEPCVKRIAITIPADQVKAETESAYREMEKYASVPGFRKGKAPRHLIKKTMSKSLMTEVGNNLVGKAYEAALKENNLQPVSEPQVENVKLAEGEPLSFVATVEVLDKFELKDFAGLEFARKVRNVGEKDADAVLERMRDRMATLEPVEGRGIAEGDFVRLDYSGKLDGQAAEPLTDTNKWVMIDPKSTLGPFLSALIGLNSGDEKGLDVAMPSDYPDPVYAGKTVRFQVKIHETKHRVLPPLDDDFARSREGSNEQTLAELKETLMKRLEEEAQMEATDRLKQNIIEKLIELNPFSVPPSLIVRESGRIAAEFENNLRMAGLEQDAITEILGKNADAIRARAIRSVKSEEILFAVKMKENVDIVPADIEKTARRMFGDKYADETLKSERETLEKNGTMNQLAYLAMKDKAYEKILEKVVVKDERVDTPEHDHDHEHEHDHAH